MNIGLIDVDKTRFPNLALGKIAAYHRSLGDSVEWADPMFGHYDRVYMSKVFTFSPDCADVYDCEIIRGGTGYSLTSVLPDEIDRLQPDYSIYPGIDSKTAYGFLTRGCPNKCKWCCVPRKEGNIRPYMDVDEIAIDGRNKLVLMDNNILACDYGLEQIEKIIKRGYRVDFNQALDARLVTEEIAAMLAQVHWLCPIRFGCDTPKQIGECERVMKMIDSHCDTPKSYLMYAMINGNMQESYERLMYFRDNKRVRSLYYAKKRKTMETTDYCEYKLSLALKECGFDEPCIAQWACEPDGKPILLGSTAFVFSNADLKGRDVTAPFLFQAQKWLREKLLLNVGANPAIPTLKWQFYIDDLNQHINPHDGELMTRWDDDMQEKADERLYDSYEAALSAGIAAALELIKKGE